MYTYKVQYISSPNKNAVNTVATECIHTYSQHSDKMYHAIFTFLGHRDVVALAH